MASVVENEFDSDKFIPFLDAGGEGGRALAAHA